MILNNFIQSIFLLLLLCILQCSSITKLDTNESVSSTCDKKFLVINNLCNDEFLLLSSQDKKNHEIKTDELFSVENLKSIQESDGFPQAVASFVTGLLNKEQTKIYLKRLASIDIAFLKKKISKKVKNIKVVLIPGVFYDRNRDIGGDGSEIRKLANRLGFKQDIIEIPPAGSIFRNGQFICNWLHENRSEKIILVSISKGSADFKVAAKYCGGQISKNKNVIAWVNLGGINKGSYLINEVDSSIFSKLYIQYIGRKYDFTYADFLSVQAGVKNSILNSDFDIPANLNVINIIPSPIERYVTDRAYKNFITLSKRGPNDGLTLLGDSYMKGAINIPIWGIDHYFKVDKEGIFFLQKILLNEAQK